MAKKVLSSRELELRPFSLGKDEAQDEGRRPEEELELRLKEAYERGLREGEQRAYKRLESEIESLRGIIESIGEYKNEILRTTEAELLDLAFKIAEKVVQISLEKDRSIVQKIIQKAVQEVKDKSEITIYISPHDEAVIMENRTKILEGIEGEIKFIVEPTIEKGGCVVQTSSGRIDALITSQLDEIRKRLGAK